MALLRTLLIGGTDLTVAIATEMHRDGFPPDAAVGIGSEFKISYAKNPVPNVRQGDMRRWSRENDVPYLESNDSKAIGAFAAEHKAELAIVAGWYHMVPKWLRDQFPRGVVGIHSSLLPKLRGGAPLVWAILSGVSETGVTLFELGDGVDDGPIYMQTPLPVGPRTTIGELVRQAEIAAVDLVRRGIPEIASGSIAASPQQGTPSYGLQRTPGDGRIDWRQTAEQIDRLVRAVSRPYPGAFTQFNGQEIKVWSARAVSVPEVLGAPGQLARLSEYDKPCVITGRGLLVTEEAALHDGSDAVSLLMASNNQRLAP